MLELTLKGREEEFAALLILLRFWRIVKLVEGKTSSTIPSHKYWFKGWSPLKWLGVAVGAGEFNEEMAEELATTKANLLQVQNDLLASRSEADRLRRRLEAAGLSVDELEHDAQGWTIYDVLINWVIKKEITQ